MALFKVYRGNETNLPATMNDGWAYFCTDSGNFYIDWDNNGILTRTQINANYASNLKYMDGDEYAEIDATTIVQGFTTMWTKISTLEGSAIKIDDLLSAVDDALEQAKANGEFDGKDGYTPVKGTDYYTETDKEEMVNAVLDALPIYSGEALLVYNGEVIFE